MIRRLSRVLVLMLICAMPALAADPTFSHDAWNALLKQHVQWNATGTATKTDYAAFKRNRTALKIYLDTLSAVPKARFDQWDSASQRAFLINVYNAYTVELILTEYPDVESIRDLGGLITSAWKKRFVPLFGAQRHLDEIEHGLLRGAENFDEPRIHFALNCASVGCPALRPEAYLGADLEAQLDDQTRRFLSDRTRNRIDRARQVLQLSKIFDWYGGDFAKGYGGADRLETFLLRYAAMLGISALDAPAIQAGEYEIEFLEYDWSLNDAKLNTPHASAP